MNELTKRDYVQEFRKAFSAGIDSIVEASGIYVAALDENSQNAALFQEAFGDLIPASAWGSFEAVGRKWMHPKLLLNAGGKYSGKIKRLPYSTQEAIFEGMRFDLLTRTGDTLKVDVMECTPDQVEQLIDGSNLRNVSAQRAYLESQKTTPKSEDVEPMPYVIYKGKVIFRRGTSMGRREIVRLLKELA